MAPHDTNGDNLIGFGSKSRAMGGVGIGTNLGAENTLSNPATPQEEHITFGARTVISKDLSINFSAVYGIKNSIDTIGTTGPLYVEHTEASGSISMKCKF